MHKANKSINILINCHFSIVHAIMLAFAEGGNKINSPKESSCVNGDNTSNNNSVLHVQLIWNKHNSQSPSIRSYSSLSTIATPRDSVPFWNFQRVYPPSYIQDTSLGFQFAFKPFSKQCKLYKKVAINKEVRTELVFGSLNSIFLFLQ